MAVQHEPDPRFPLLSAFELEGDVEDGLTASHRPVFGMPLLGLEPVTEPQALAAWAPASPPEPAHPVVQRAERWLGLLGRLVDARIANEEVGDALERMSQVARAGAPGWALYGMACVSTFWVLVHGVRERLGTWKRQGSP